MINMTTFEEAIKDAPRLAGRLQTCYDSIGPADSLSWYWMKGHEDKADFAAAVNWDYEREYTAEDVDRGYCRNVPTGIGSDMVMLLVKEGASRLGAYPITFIDVDAVDIRRIKAKHSLC